MDELIQAFISFPKLSPVERQAVTQNLIAYLQSISTIWLDTIGSELNVDSLIPLTVELLPDNNEQLKLLLARIEEAIKIETEGINCSALTNFYSAVYVKLNESMLIPDADPIDDENKQNILLVTNQIAWQRDIVILKKACNEYKLYLIAESKNNPNDKELQTKYIAILDALLTLRNKELTRSYRLLVFSEKFDHFHHLFKEKDAFVTFFKDISHNIGIDKFIKPTPEELFIKTARFFSKKIKSENIVTGDMISRNTL